MKEFNEKKIICEIESAYLKYLDTYFVNRDLENLSKLLSKKCCGYGTGKDEQVKNYDDCMRIFKRDIEQAPNPVNYTLNDVNIVVLSETAGIVYGMINISTVICSQELKINNMRFSLVFTKESNNWMLVHIHISLPTTEHEDNESYPLKELQERNAVLQKLVEEKTLELKNNLKNTENRANFQRSQIFRILTEKSIIKSDINIIAKKIIEIVSETINVSRTSIWWLSDDKTELICLDCYEKNKSKSNPDFNSSKVLDIIEESNVIKNSNNTENFNNNDTVNTDSANKGIHSVKKTLELNQYPVYFENIIKYNRISIEDAQNDYRTKELLETYLKPAGITSILEAGIFIEGKLVGILSCEHIGEKRSWFTDEESFLITVSAIFSQIIENIERKKSEKSLALAKEQAERAKEQAETANKAKSIFIANISHELRTPLNAVIGFTDLLKYTDLNDEQKENVNNIHISANSLLDVINDILDFSKIEAGKIILNYTKIDIIELVNNILKIVKLQIEKKELEFLFAVSSNIPKFVRVDALRLKQILINLLGNAAKFTEKGKIVFKLSFRKIDEKKGKLNFLIADTGVGIKKEHQKIIFKPFLQADDTSTRKFGGSGLGLTISNLLANKMGSKIRFKSKYEKGSIFYFSIKTEYENISSEKSKTDNEQVRIIENEVHFDEELFKYNTDYYEDSELFYKIIICSLDNMPKQFDELKVAVENKDIKCIKNVAHKIKGSASNLCLIQLSQKLLELEKMNETTEYEDILKLYEEIMTEWQLVKNILKNILIS